MRGYIWESAWCWPYESAWSIMEKFKYANAVTNDAFKKIFGLRSTSPEWNIMQSLYIYRRSNLNESEFFKFFHIKDTHFSYLDKFNNNDFTQVFHKEIYYCPECMKLGYHSYLHQFTFSNSCPFHNVQEGRRMYPVFFIPPYNDGKKYRTVMTQTPKTHILSANLYELEIIRLLYILEPNNETVIDMVLKTISRLKTTCFGNRDDGLGECYDTSLIYVPSYMSSAFIIT